MQELRQRRQGARTDGFQAERRRSVTQPTKCDPRSVSLSNNSISAVQVVNEEAQRLENRDLPQRRISEFSARASGAGYTEGLFNIMNAAPEWTVLDVEGASGGLSISSAQRVRRVTAMELSKDVCDHSDQYDVVVAPGSCLNETSALPIAKLSGAARKKIFIVTSVGDGPFDRRLYEATGRSLDMGPSFTYIYYNILHKHLGILPDIAFIGERKPNEWDSREEALEAQKWMFYDLTKDEEQKIGIFLDKHLIRADGRWKLPYEREGKWAVMWWEKEEKQSWDRRNDKRFGRRSRARSISDKRNIAFE
jgi:hypothetical protein